jgi:hypothetical protein
MAVYGVGAGLGARLWGGDRRGCTFMGWGQAWVHVYGVGAGLGARLWGGGRPGCTFMGCYLPSGCFLEDWLRLRTIRPSCVFP